MASSNKENKKSGGKKIAFFILILVIVGVTTGCLFSPVFNITEVRASSGDNVTAQEIINIANISKGTNIFRINDSKIKSQIESLPYVKEANIYRLFPSTIILKVEEREPYAIVKYLESFAVADKFGYILEIKKENDLNDLPIIYGLDSGDCTVGKKLEGNSLTKYENCAYLIETADKVQFAYKFHEINYNDATNVKFYLEDIDMDVIYGNVVIDNIEEKLSHLSSILKELNGKKGKIDMSDENYLAKTVFTEKK